MSVNSRLPGFYKLDLDERLAKIIDASDADEESLADFRANHEDLLPLVDGMVENAVGTCRCPLGVGANFRVNGRDYLVPMATEEPSVIAAASNMARVARTTEDSLLRRRADHDRARSRSSRSRTRRRPGCASTSTRQELLDLANEQDPVLVRLGGGARDIDVRIVRRRTSATYVVLHLLVDVGDAMGANAVNTMAEGARAADRRDRRRATCCCGSSRTWPTAGSRARARSRRRPTRSAVPTVVDGDRSTRMRFAEADPYRAATHNKGIMNGIDAVVLATGNDWRAVEAGCHAYAARRRSLHVAVAHGARRGRQPRRHARAADGRRPHRRGDEDTPDRAGRRASPRRRDGRRAGPGDGRGRPRPEHGAPCGRSPPKASSAAT